MSSGPITLLILDGFGDGPRNSFDATFAADMPHFTLINGMPSANGVDNSSGG